ncbi:hypothetical protein Tco_0229645, partial [Tanacetum coccineum]
YASIISGIEETAATNWFVCLSSEKSISKVFSLWSNPNKEPKLGRYCREELGAVAGVGTVSGLGLSMLETKPDDIEELCC